jgi:hypothetical protein
MAFQLDCVWNHNEVKRKRRMPTHFVAKFQKPLFCFVSTVPTQLLHLPMLTDTDDQLFSRKCFHQLEIIFYIVSINDSSISLQYTGTVSRTMALSTDKPSGHLTIKHILVFSACLTPWSRISLKRNWYSLSWPSNSPVLWTPKFLPRLSARVHYRTEFSVGWIHSTYSSPVPLRWI